MIEAYPEASRHPKARLLIVDDNTELCELLTKYLGSQGFDVAAVNNAAHGIEHILAGEYALVLLYVMMPDMNGFDVLKRVRAESDTPVLMLTERGEDADRIVGLELGADDYLPKPFNGRELLARIHAILRRTDRASGNAQAVESLVIGDIALVPSARVVRLRGEIVELTGVEFDLLEVLLRSAGRVVMREELFRSVLGRRMRPYDRSLDVHISKLRKKLGPRPGDRDRIKTIRGRGYIYAHGPASCHGEAAGKIR